MKATGKPQQRGHPGHHGRGAFLTAKIDDAQSQVNLLNEKGILTVFNSYGSGWKVWGNRSSAWPTETDWETFICVRRTKDIIDESIRYSSAQFMDRPIDKALIDTHPGEREPVFPQAPGRWGHHGRPGLVRPGTQSGYED